MDYSLNMQFPFQTMLTQLLTACMYTEDQGLLYIYISYFNSHSFCSLFLQDTFNFKIYLNQNIFVVVFINISWKTGNSLGLQINSSFKLLSPPVYLNNSFLLQLFFFLLFRESNFNIIALYDLSQNIYQIFSHHLSLFFLFTSAFCDFSQACPLVTNSLFLVNAKSAVDNSLSFQRVHIVSVFLSSASFLFTVCYKFISCFRPFMFYLIFLTEPSSWSMLCSCISCLFHSFRGFVGGSCFCLVFFQNGLFYCVQRVHMGQ